MLDDKNRNVGGAHREPGDVVDNTPTSGGTIEELESQGATRRPSANEEIPAEQGGYGGQRPEDIAAMPEGQQKLPTKKTPAQDSEEKGKKDVA